MPKVTLTFEVDLTDASLMLAAYDILHAASQGGPGEYATATLDVFEALVETLGGRVPELVHTCIHDYGNLESVDKLNRATRGLYDCFIRDPEPSD